MYIVRQGLYMISLVMVLKQANANAVTMKNNGKDIPFNVNLQQSEPDEEEEEEKEDKNHGNSIDRFILLDQKDLNLVTTEYVTIPSFSSQRPFRFHILDIIFLLLNIDNQSFKFYIIKAAITNDI